MEDLYEILKSIAKWIGLLGILGGLGFWINLYRKRPKVVIRDLEQNFPRPPEQQSNKVSTTVDFLLKTSSSLTCISFELENLSEIPNSLYQKITLKGYGKGEKYCYTFFIEDENRNLPPNTPRIFNAWAKSVENCNPFRSQGYRTYVFKFTRGGKRRVRLRAKWNEPLNLDRVYRE